MKCQSPLRVNKTSSNPFVFVDCFRTFCVKGVRSTRVRRDRENFMMIADVACHRINILLRSPNCCTRRFFDDGRSSNETANYFDGQLCESRENGVAMSSQPALGVGVELQEQVVFLTVDGTAPCRSPATVPSLALMMHRCQMPLGRHFWLMDLSLSR